MQLILFLDFDGVVHPHPPNSEHPLWCCTAHLAEWLARHPDVVISSTWRKGRSVEQLKTLLPPVAGHRVIGSTPAETVELYTRQIECHPLTPYLHFDKTKDFAFQRHG